MSRHDTAALLVYGLKQRMARTLVRHNPNRWAELQAKLHVMHGWLVEAERAGRR